MMRPAPNPKLAAARAVCVFAAGAMLAGAASPALTAQSLKQIRAQQAEERMLEDQAGYTQQLCGIRFSVSIDWSSFDHWPEGAGVARACDRGLSEIETQCRNGEAPRVTRFVCTGDGSGSYKSGGTVEYGASPR
ncbi:hypothetical protein [Hyphococcus luteus]|uniref:Uncharacterized protein n=1 Tax=Hyphococcus luteus TaxID=2058213 RepID=A0A2S7K7J5_9PROT|nr:hypothetical protein [Marinicaulis flavus]PQA88470.1 hypothetical protein CW354_09275 [Marinicaulis flavus]